jgi:hypothetical protein
MQQNIRPAKQILSPGMLFSHAFLKILWIWGLECGGFNS